jgi:transposase
MIGSTRAVRVFARNRPTDLRKGFDGLYGLVINELGRDPLKGDLYLFINTRRTSAKVLLWDGTGLCIYAKRLSRKRFSKLWRDTAQGSALKLTHAELRLFLEGADLAHRLPISPPEIHI